ncbi:MAG: PH domain-containing protein [Rothia sp. (in: high G+C Gram-positive bacteria)]|nr:PH domain-containing protein [Rothia sp. (in: high G+C Gram-positive bacteria)]
MNESKYTTPVSSSNLPVDSGQEVPRFTATLPPLDCDGLGKQSIDLPEVIWKRVSPKYVRVKLITSLVWSLILLGLVSLPLVMTLVVQSWNWAPWVYWGLPALVLVWRIWSLVLVKRRVQAIGYSERADHLLKCSGLLFRSVTAVPYGRIQYVDVSSGPLQSALSLASVEVKTAANSIIIPGLAKSDADQLREVLTDLSDARMAGL